MTRVIESKCRRMFLRDGRVIDVSGMDSDDLTAFITEIERLNSEGVRIMHGVEFIVEGETFPKGVKRES